MSGKILIAAFVFILFFWTSGCEFFNTEQERRGVNPKPFNGPSSWENRGYQFRN